MSFNQYRMPPFNNIPPHYFPPPPPAYANNLHAAPGINVDFSRPPPPFMTPTNRPPNNFHQSMFTPTIPPPPPTIPPPLPQASPYCDYRPRIPPPQFVQFGVRQYSPDQRPQRQGQAIHGSCASRHGPRWSGPRHTQTPGVDWKPLNSSGKSSNGGENSWPVKRHHVDQKAAANVQPTKKVRIDKRELPENNAFYCDRCDRGFKTSEKLQEHVDEHVKCRVDGCNYLAAPRLVQLHFEFHHRTGLAKKIWLTHEDDEKWILERKRNYPTAENLERKRKEAAERRARGDVLDNRYFGKMRGGGRGSRGSRGGRGGYTFFGGRDEHSSVDELIPVPVLIKSESIVTDAVDVPTAKDPNAERVLNEADSATNILEHVEHSKPVNQKPASQPKSLNSTSHSLDKRSEARCPKTFQRRKKSTLLEKLLAPEIRHERNVILQCIRFVVGHYGLRDSQVQNKDIAINVGDVPSVVGTSQDQTTQQSCPVLPDKESLATSDNANGLVECTDGDSGIGSPARNNISCSVLEEEGVKME